MTADPMEVREIAPERAAPALSDDVPTRTRTVNPDYSWHWAERGLLVVRVVGAEGPPPQCVMIGGRVRGGRRRV
ncbi:MAG: hypothetical protein AB7I48_27205, partial [Planctomycetaceae bacterium]